MNQINNPMALDKKNPDYEYHKGKELLDKLEGDNGIIIRYYFAEQGREIIKLEKRIADMQEVFNGIKRFVE